MGAPGAHLGAPGAHIGAHFGAPPPPQGAPSPQKENMVFQHLFTMMISGPTGNFYAFFLKYFTFLVTFVA